MVNKSSEWVLCLVCGNKTRLQLRADTELKNFPLFCPKCKQESISNAKDMQITIGSLSALLLQLSEPAAYTLFFGWFWRSAFVLDLLFPLGKVTVVLFGNCFRFSESSHKHLHIGITVCFQRIGQLIQPFSHFLLGLREKEL